MGLCPVSSGRLPNSAPELLAVSRPLLPTVCCVCWEGLTTAWLCFFAPHSATGDGPGVSWDAMSLLFRPEALGLSHFLAQLVSDTTEPRQSV